IINHFEGIPRVLGGLFPGKWWRCLFHHLLIWNLPGSEEQMLTSLKQCFRTSVALGLRTFPGGNRDCLLVSDLRLPPALGGHHPVRKRAIIRCALRCYYRASGRVIPKTSICCSCRSTHSSYSCITKL